MRTQFLIGLALLATIAVALADDAIEFKVPDGTKFTIPKGQQVNAVVEVKFPGEKPINFGTADFKLSYRIVGGKLFMSFDPKKKPEAFGFGTKKVDIQAKVGDGDFETGTSFHVDYGGKAVVVELKPVEKDAP